MNNLIYSRIQSATELGTLFTRRYWDAKDEAHAVGRLIADIGDFCLRFNIDFEAAKSIAATIRENRARGLIDAGEFFEDEAPLI